MPCHCPRSTGLAGWLVRLVAQEGDCGLKSHQRLLASRIFLSNLTSYYNTGISHVLSDGANNTFVKICSGEYFHFCENMSNNTFVKICCGNILMKKKRIKREDWETYYYILHKRFLVIADIITTSLCLFIYRSYLFM